MTWNFSIEVLALAVVGFLAFVVGPSRRSKERYLKIATALGRNRWLAIGVASLTALAMTLILARAYQPVPFVHDEFSYLLAADTYAHGRATNPTHPMWEHFETFHVIHNPSYMSKYPPMQGLFLAAGQLVYGHPIAGVWLSVALAAGAFCWMLFGWLPPRWAAFGGLLFGLHPIQFLVWGQSYYGGSVAVLGASLLFGALPRIKRKPQFSGGLALAAGLVVLVNSRPFEGFVISLPVALALLVWLVRVDSKIRVAALWRVVLPVTVILAAAGAAMAWHNQQITGDPFKLPYQVHEETYAVTPLFVFGTPRSAPEYRHHEVRRLFEFEGPKYYWNPQQTFDGWRQRKRHELFEVWRQFAGAILSVPLLAIPWILKSRRLLLIIVTIGMCTAVSMTTTWLYPHYLAPLLPLTVLLSIQGMRQVRILKSDRGNIGRTFAQWLIVLYATLICVKAGFYLQHKGVVSPLDFYIRQQAEAKSVIQEQLQTLSGKHLVVVKYDPTHGPFEWVNNEADIDASRIVWARNMDAKSNGELMSYFKDRRQWLVLADERPPRLIEHKTRHEPPTANSPSADPAKESEE
jgi:hypothetical protein